MENAPKLLSVQEAGERLGLKKSAVYNLIAADAIPVVRTSRGGHGFLFHPEVLEAWIREGGVKQRVGGVTVSSGRPTWPSTPPALFTRMSTRPWRPQTSPTSSCTAGCA